MLIIRHTVKTKASKAAIWGVWKDVANWNRWDHGIEWSSLNGPFAEGTTGALKPTEGPVVRTKLTCVEPLKKFVDEAKLPLEAVLKPCVVVFEDYFGLFSFQIRGLISAPVY